VEPNAAILPRRTATASEFARRSRALRLIATHEPVLITRHGRPVAVLDATPDVLPAQWDPRSTVSARDLSRTDAAARVLDAVEAGTTHVLTLTNVPVAVLRSARGIQERLSTALEDAFAGIGPDDRTPSA
jgi:antitoxin (DNA-binding transcriptional repressor) of toxin-antitoxin stability system